MASNRFSVSLKDIIPFNKDMHHGMKMVTLNCCLSHDWKLSIILGLISLIPCQEMFIKHSALHRDFTLIWDCLLVVCCLVFPFIFLSSKKQCNYWKTTWQFWYLKKTPGTKLFSLWKIQKSIWDGYMDWFSCQVTLQQLVHFGERLVNFSKAKAAQDKFFSCSDLLERQYKVCYRTFNFKSYMQRYGGQK